YTISHVTLLYSFFFLSTPTASTEIYTLSLHDALPIFAGIVPLKSFGSTIILVAFAFILLTQGMYWRGVIRFVDSRDMIYPSFTTDRKSTRLNSSHVKISYAVFCLKKKKQKKNNTQSST